jgi:hypothetical protein
VRNAGYVFGLARNHRLVRAIGAEMREAETEAQASGQPTRRFKDLTWKTRKSWSRTRRVVAKAEWTNGKANPRFVVTPLPAAAVQARRLYQGVYCARGEMENLIKECQIDLFADRTSAGAMRASQLRLWSASLAYVMIAALRRIGLAGTRLAQASCGTIRLR